MKGLVLAGGKGTRLRPLTHTRPKPMVPVANRPLIEHVIEDLRLAGITDIGVVLGNFGRDAIRSYLDDGSEFGVDITYIVQGNPLGIAHAIACAEKFIGDEPFITYLSDNLLGKGVDRFVQGFANTDASAGILLYEVENPTAFGVADLGADGNICGFEEKPDEPPSSKALVGVYGFTPDVFDVIPKLSLSARGELEITEVLEKVLRSGTGFFHQTADGWWKDTGRPGDLITANHHVLDRYETRNPADSMVRIADSATVSASTQVCAPTVIGPNCRIHGGRVGPYVSVGPDATIRDTHISESIVMSRSMIHTDRTISKSLIGQDVELVDGLEDDPKQGVIVGDDAVVRL